MSQKINRLGIALPALALFAGCPSIAVADQAPRGAVPAPAPAATALAPSNTVVCVYNLLSIEDREMALLLFEREVASGVKIHTGSRNLKVIKRLVDEARVKCSSPYHWSNALTEVASAYAMNELMSVGLMQALEAKGHTPGTIDAYYTKHRAELASIQEIEGVNADEFQVYLFEQGWAKGETTTFMTAKFYLEALLTRDLQTQIFSAASSRPTAASKAKANRLPNRARTTRRGRP